MAEFAVNNKTHSAIKVSLFIVNYGKKLRIKVDIKRKCGKSNGICRENEKALGRSRNSIEKNIRRNKITSK